MNRRTRRSAMKRGWQHSASRQMPAGTPAGADAHIRLGDAAAAAGRMEEAEAHYRAALDTEPNNTVATGRLGYVHYNFGNAHRREGRLEDAVAAYRRALEFNPEFPEVHNNLGITLQDKGRLDDAIAAFRRALEIRPGFIEALSNLGNALRDSGKGDEAIGSHFQAVRGERDSQAALNNLGISLLRRGDLREAEDCFRRATVLDPAYADGHHNLGNLLRIQGRLDDAVACCKAAVRLRPDWIEALNSLGMALGERGDIADAIDRLQHAIALEPDYADAHVTLGNLLLEANRIEEAIAHYRRALAVRPDHREANSNVRKATSRLLPSWHFTMLADTARNEAFQIAIEKAVTESSRVLDIGTGSGLLALMAARAGASEVIACESAPSLAAVAREIVAANGYSDRIHVIDTRSTQLRLGTDLSRPADIVIAEILDVGVLGEGVLPTLRHAIANLAAPDAAVIPAGASVYGMLVEMSRLRTVNPLTKINGFDLSAFDRFRNADDYLNINLAWEPHRPLSEPFPVIAFDFRRPPPSFGVNRPQQTALDVEATDDGVVQAVVFWFDLHLDSEITVSNRPGGELRHWGQAVQFLDRDLLVVAGETVRITASCTDARIAFSFA